MPIKAVNLDGGLNTQIDEFSIGFQGFVDMVNLRLDDGKIVQRYGTGTPTTISNALIDNMEVFTSRKLQSVSIALSSATKYTFNTSAKTLTLSGTDPTSGVTIPGSSSNDWTTVFKVGDAIFINAQDADNDKIYTINTITSTVITFENAPGATETNIASGSLTLGFAYTVTSALNQTVAHIPYSSSNSFNGEAFLCTYSNSTNRRIGFLNTNNYADFTQLLSLSNSSDIHMRLNAYTDAVRFNSGLEDTPYIFKYVNRHFFNGMLKSTYNANCKQLYPHWMIDTAVPPTPSGSSLLGTTGTTIFESRSATASNSYVKGSLNTIDNIYRYKLVPVFDGNQEEILDNAIFETSTASAEKIPDVNGILGPNTSCVKMGFDLVLSQLNPRMSSMNLYRSTNNGPYYKINSIYLGDNDPNHKLLEELYSATDTLWWTGGGTYGDIDATSAKLCVDGFVYDFTGGSADDDHVSGGYNKVTLGTSTEALGEFAATVTNDSRMDSLCYGAQKTCIWNKKSEATDTIFANNGEAIGGSASGGWFAFENVDDSEYDGDVGVNISGSNNISVDTTDTTDGPFTTDFLDANAGQYNGAFEASYYGADNSSNSGFSMARGEISTSLSISQTYIVSGWIMAEGFSRKDSEWSIFVGATGLDTQTENGDLLIAQGSGGDENQNIDKWRWFQYQYTPSNTTQYLYVRTLHPSVSSSAEATNAIIRLKGFAIRETLDNFTLTDNMKGFAGRNILYGSKITDIGAPDGALAGGRIQDISTASGGYPKEHDASMTFVADNNGPFIQAVGDIPSVDDSLSQTDYHFGTNHYQWYAKTDNTGSNMYIDFFDPGLPDGALHPIQATSSLDVKHKYSTILNGRQFVANVKITSDTEIEEYPNFVMFSNANAPDIIPVSNFIQLQDLQGGEIVGIESLMSDLVVFMTNGIFRISVPSNDPSSWSLVEAHPNIGCLHDKMIAKAPNGIYFGSQSDIYFLDSGFQVKPITTPIRDRYQVKSYQSNSANNLRLRYDEKYNRLLLIYFPATSTTIYNFDVTRGVWYGDSHSSASYDEMSSDNNGSVVLIETAVGDSANTAVRSAYNTSSYQDAGSVAIDWKLKTGKQILSTLDANTILRRVNTIVTHHASAVDDDLDVITDKGTVSKGNHLDGTQSTRLSHRGKFIQIEINNDDNQNYEHQINYIDVEYE